MGHAETPAEAAAKTQAPLLSPAPTSRRRSNADEHRRQTGVAAWRKWLLCCLKAADDDVSQLDYRHHSLADVPTEVR